MGARGSSEFELPHLKDLTYIKYNFFFWVGWSLGVSGCHGRMDGSTRYSCLPNCLLILLYLVEEVVEQTCQSFYEDPPGCLPPRALQNAHSLHQTSNLQTHVTQPPTSRLARSRPCGRSNSFSTGLGNQPDSCGPSHR